MKITYAILILALILNEAINANYCLGGPTFTGMFVDKKPVLKEGNKCFTVSTDEVLTPISCPPRQKKK